MTTVSVYRNPLNGESSEKDIDMRIIPRNK